MMGATPPPSPAWIPWGRSDLARVAVSGGGGAAEDDGVTDLALSGGADGPLTSTGPDQGTGGALVCESGRGGGGARTGGFGHGAGEAVAFGRALGCREEAREGRSALGPFLPHINDGRSMWALEMSNS